ncbi:MAG: S1C family serine protease [Peptococcia bacterium]
MFAKTNSAVFSIEIYDEYGFCIGSGSGFFIDNKGKAVTNYHVLEDAYSAKAFLSDGREVNITKVQYADEHRDIAIIQLESVSNNFIPLGDSNQLATGQKVLAIGNPMGLENTISDGIVSTTNRLLGDVKYVQVTTPISPGSSGGVLLNYYGEAVGITTAYYLYGQNLNFAIPINDIKPIINASNNNLTIRPYQKITKDLRYENRLVSFTYPSDWSVEREVNKFGDDSIMLVNKINSSIIAIDNEPADSMPFEIYYNICLASYNLTWSAVFDSYEVHTDNNIITLNNKQYYKINGQGIIEGIEIKQVIYITQANSNFYRFSLTTDPENLNQCVTVLEQILNNIQFK